MEKSLAAVAIAPLKTELQEFQLPMIGPDDGLMKVEAVGVCGSDWSFYNNEIPRMIEFPLILGHECVGRIAKIGKRAAKKWGLKEGDRVVVEEPFPCGHCRLCRSVNYQLCQSGGRYGAISTKVNPALWGGYSQYMYLHPNSILYKISDSVPKEEAPMFIPLSNGIRWVQQVGGLTIGQTVVIEGPGQHGLGCVIAAKQAGAGCVIVTGMGKDDSRLQVAKELGADYTINIEQEDPVEKVRKITGGEMVDLVVDVTAGAPQALNTAIDLARIGGSIVVAGLKHKPVPDFQADELFFKELTVKGVFGRDFRAVEPAIQLIESGRLPLNLMCTHTFALEETDLALHVSAGRISTDVPPIHVTVNITGV